MWYRVNESWAVICRQTSQLCRRNEGRFGCVRFGLIFFWPRTFRLNFLICINVEVNLLFHPSHALLVIPLYPNPNRTTLIAFCKDLLIDEIKRCIEAEFSNPTATKRPQRKCPRPKRLDSLSASPAEVPSVSSVLKMSV